MEVVPQSPAQRASSCTAELPGWFADALAATGMTLDDAVVLDDEAGDEAALAAGTPPDLLDQLASREDAVPREGAGPPPRSPVAPLRHGLDQVATSASMPEQRRFPSRRQPRLVISNAAHGESGV